MTKCPCCNREARNLYRCDGIERLKPYWKTKVCGYCIEGEIDQPPIIVSRIDLSKINDIGKIKSKFKYQIVVSGPYPKDTHVVKKSNKDLRLLKKELEKEVNRWEKVLTNSNERKTKFFNGNMYTGNNVSIHKNKKPFLLYINEGQYEKY